MKLSAPPPPPPPPEPPAPGEQPDPNANQPSSNAETNAAATPEVSPAPETDITGAPSTAPAPKPLQWPSWFPGADFTIAGLVLVLAFATASFVARNSDVWLHLAAGKRLFQGEYIPGGSDPFSYSTADRTWVNHSWLTDAGTYLLYGGEGKVLGIAKAIVVALAFGVLLAIRRERYSLWPWAVLACIAVLAAAPQFLLRPQVMSMLFLAITLFLVFRMPRGSNPWRFPIAIGITFWLWANCDSWFILGPLTLVLLIIGEVIQQNMLNSSQPSEEDEPLGRMPELSTLVKALGIGVIACMLNPHHVRVWELPFELTGAPGAIDDGRLRTLLLPTYDSQYYSNARMGQNLNGLAFAILVVVGALALGFGQARLQASHIALWGGFLLLALFRVVAIPYFAIVAVPLIAAQLNAYSAKVKLEAWGNPKSRLLWISSYFGRVVCMLGIVALCVAAYPGWVHPETSNPAYARRFAWGVEADVLSVKAAEQLNQWREQEKLTPNKHGIITSTDLANYVAWFAPREKVFINSRYNHHLRELSDYLKLRRGLGLVSLKESTVDLNEAAEVLKEAGAEYLSISAGATDGLIAQALAAQATGMLYGKWQDWSLWYIDGRTTVFGWRSSDAKEDPEFAALRFDPVVRAFDPNTPRLPEEPMKGPLPQLGWEEAFLRPAKATPPAVAECFGWINYRHAMQPRFEQWQRTMNRAQRMRTLRANFLPGLPATTETSPHQIAMWWTLTHNTLPQMEEPRPPATPEPSGDIFAARAVSILALRAARRAIAEDPDHPDGYIALAAALELNELPLSESERKLGISIAFQQCLARMPKPDHYRRGQYILNASDVALKLVDLYLGPPIGVQQSRTDDKKQEPLVRFSGMTFDIPGLGEMLGSVVVLRQDRSGRVATMRVPFSQFNPNDPTQRQLTGVTILPLDVAYETLKLAIEYRKTEISQELQEGAKTEAGQRLQQIETFKKELETEIVRANQSYEEAKSRGLKLPELVDRTRFVLPGTALELLNDDKIDVVKEYGQNAAFAPILQVALELALGKIERADGRLYGKDGLSSPESTTALERAGLAPVVQQLKYQKAFQAGEYKTAGEILEKLEGQFQSMEAATAELAKRKITPNNILLAEFARQHPPPLIGSTILPAFMFQNALLEQGIQAIRIRAEIANKMQQDAQFFFRRGILSVLEGDIPGAKQRFLQTKRKAPAGWGLRNFERADADGYLQMIEIAEKKSK